MIQILPRLRYLRELDGSENPTRIVLSPEPVNYIIESLAALGYGAEDFVYMDEKGARVGELVVLPFTENNRFITPETLDWLQKTLADWSKACSPVVDTHRSVSTFPGRLTKRGRILNEDELVEALTPLGFETLDLELYSLAKRRSCCPVPGCSWEPTAPVSPICYSVPGRHYWRFFPAAWSQPTTPPSPAAWVRPMAV